MNNVNFLEDISYKEDKPHIQLMLKSPFSKEIRICMKQGQEMKEHQTPYPIMVHLLEGEITFGIQGKLIALKKGDLLSLEGGIAHNLIAKQNSVIKLSLSTDDSLKRVQEVVA